MPTPLIPRIGAIVIGDELLSGKRTDKHLPRLIEMLAARGLELSWARILGDDAQLLTQNLRESFASGHLVFSFGGIGGTPDDRTRQCAGAALDLPLQAHPEGIAELEAQFGPGGTPLRLRMVQFPAGADIIPNPVNRVPGFSIRDHHFVPGFPSMAWPMVEWVLDQRYANLHRIGGVIEQGMTVFDCRESQIIALMEEFEQRYPMLRISCLPHAELRRYQLELALRGDPASVDEAIALLRERVTGMGFQWEPLAAGSGQSRLP
jgi:molybdopterin-biosynthesis enzyme MoeA-like protein